MTILILEKENFNGVNMTISILSGKKRLVLIHEIIITNFYFYEIKISTVFYYSLTTNTSRRKTSYPTCCSLQEQRKSLP